MNFLFFEREGQSYKMPRVLEDENIEVCVFNSTSVLGSVLILFLSIFLQNAFNRDGHVDVLDLVCVQCEPDSAEYIKVALQNLNVFVAKGHI